MFSRADKESLGAGRQAEITTTKGQSNRSSFSQSSAAEKKSTLAGEFKPNIEKSRQSLNKNKAQTEFYMGLLKERSSFVANEEDLDEQGEFKSLEGKDNEKDSNENYGKQLKKEVIEKGNKPGSVNGLKTNKGLPQKNDIQNNRTKVAGVPPRVVQSTGSGKTTNPIPKAPLSSQKSKEKEVLREENSIQDEQKARTIVSKNKSESDKLKEELENLKEDLSNARRENYEQSIKIKEEKMEQKRLKAKINQLETEKADLNAKLQEKQSIISQHLLKTKDNFEEHRNYLLRSQMIKQRYHIQHLTKIIKNNRTIQAEIEYQLNNLESILESVCNNNDGTLPQKVQNKIEMQQIAVVNLRKKFNQLLGQSSFDLSQNVLKEYVTSSGTEISKQTLIIELESTANKVHNSSLALFKTLQKPSKESAEVAMYLKQLIEICLKCGMNVSLEENQCEIVRSNEEIRNEALRNVRDKIGGFETSMIENILFNGKLFEFLHQIQVDRGQLLHKYKSNSAVESYISSLFTGDQSKKFLKQQSGVLSRIKECVGLDMDTLNKMNNLLRVLLFQSQISLQYLNSFVVDQLSRFDQIIKECIYKPISDMREIRVKYLLRDRDPNYPIHIARLFDIHCDSLFSNIQQIIDIHNHETFKTAASMNLPLIAQIQHVYGDLMDSLK